ncbi:MAG: hypothetical protein PHC66_01505 [Candidatus Nanoarchaeia archaeon]|nr:hypothetical protein [Candidatus Nanoarchaeia archaeon]MDD5239165.1 hypothetical protein [Candidatus Nanoarchaeia archaeon]
MACSRHKLLRGIVKKIVLEYNQTGTDGSYDLLEQQDVIKLSDPTRHSRLMLEYDPDSVIKRNLSLHSYYYIVFEVISKQKADKTMADIARILAQSEIKRALFLTTSDEKKIETDTIVKTLQALYKKRFSRRGTDLINIQVLQILDSDGIDEIKSLIINEIKDLLPPKSRQTNHSS